MNASAYLGRYNYNSKEYDRIASSLVEKYSTHEFVIDRREAGPSEGRTRSSASLGLHISIPSAEVEGLFDRLAPHLERLTVIGKIVVEAIEVERA